MATKQAVRFVSRRFSTSGKVLGEEEKAAENIYIKKIEQEKLEKLAHKGSKPSETPAAANTSGSAGEAKASAPGPTKGVSTDIHRNYAVVAGTVTGLSALGWYLLSKDKTTEELLD